MTFENLSDEDRYQLGLMIGTSIASLFEMMAKIDRIPVQEGVDRWVESYIADKIIEATGDEHAAE